jgi:hypothetical protein
VVAFGRDAALQVDLGDQHIDGFERRHLRRRRRGFLMAALAGQHRSHSARGEGDPEYDKTRGFHYASLSKKTLRRGRRLRGIPPAKRQSMVNEAYLNRVNCALRLPATHAQRPSAAIHSVCG